MLLGASCKTKSPIENEATKRVENSDTTVLLTNADVVEQEPIETCNCNGYQSKFGNFDTELRFYASFPKENDSILSLYSKNDLSLSIKSISINGFDTIPGKFAIFKNVEQILTDGNTRGLDMFPNLKSVSIWGLFVANPSDKWLRKIERISVQKGVIRGLTTFKNTPNLKEIELSFSSFEPFPTDFDQLKCLRMITLGAHRGNIDLSQIDLSQNPCLEKVVFSTWFNAFSGIPKGLDTDKTFQLTVEHQKLTKEEKEKIKEFNNRRKSKK